MGLFSKEPTWTPELEQELNQLFRDLAAALSSETENTQGLESMRTRLLELSSLKSKSQG